MPLVFVYLQQGRFARDLLRAVANASSDLISSVTEDADGDCSFDDGEAQFVSGARR